MKLYIDVRETVEFESDHLKGALNIPLTSLMSGKARLDLLPTHAKLVVYCRTGNRSLLAIKILKKYGFDDVENGFNQENLKNGY